MCTVTFFPLNSGKYVLTSNRDELPERGTIPPQSYIYEQVQMVFPKDKVAGGTWIGTSERKRMLSLMNGGFVPHKRKEAYKMSRGIIVLQLLAAKDIFHFLKTFDFNGIEPFTIVLFSLENTPKLYQIVWDEHKIHLEDLEIKPRIWSSSPLYSPTMHSLRKEWFADLQVTDETPLLPEDIWKFHHEAGNGDKRVSLIMDRGFIKTKSISQFIMENNKVTTYYHDLQDESFEKNELKIV